MRRTSFADMECSVAQALEVVGEWWTLLIIRDAFLGVTRFEDFQQRLGIARNILAARLDALVDHGVLERRLYDEARDRSDYRLTAKGRALWPVLTTLRQWGDKYAVGGRGHEPLLLRHDTCGTTTNAHLACDHCGEKLVPKETSVHPGPGLRDPDALFPPALRR
jgi:DNA-binding HxlR family transcriptional regulator